MVFIGLIALIVSTLLLPAAGLAGTPCEDLASALPPGTIDVTTQSVPAGSFTPPGSTTPLTNLPAFCRVAATLTPTPDSLIGVEVWMPTTTWNQKFRGEGSGGSAGAFSFGPMATALQLGYATMSTDNGHKGQAWTFAAQPEKVNDFGYRAFHESTLAAKALIAAFYGTGPRLSYYVGCSQGGHHGLMEAQRFPADFDGIVAGDPGHDWTHLMIGELWTGIVSHMKSPETDLPQAKLNLLTQKVLAACGDPINGPLGFLVDPRRCAFDPAQLTCTAGDAPDCLTPAQVESVKQIYQGPVNPRSGEQIFPGFKRGSENAWRQVLVGPRLNGVPIPGGSSFQFFTNGIFMDPNYDFHTFDFDSDAQFTDDKRAGSGMTYAEALDALDPDLKAFKQRGGKLIMYHGFADPFVTPQSSLDYYSRLTDASNGPEETTDFARLFMVPGMWHCAGGPGPSIFDPFAPLTRWVEQGIAPDRIIGTHTPNAAGPVAFTRPLCPYPQEATYNGRGDTTDAANYSCKVVVPPTLQGKAEKVGGAAGSGKVTISTKASFSGPIDLRNATLRLQQVLVEQAGAGELVRGSGGAQFLPIQLRPQPGAKAGQAVFATVAGALPGVTIQVKSTNSDGGQLQLSLKIEGATVVQAAGCATAASVGLRTRLTLDDQVDPAFDLNVEQPWQCKKGELKTP